MVLREQCIEGVEVGRVTIMDTWQTYASQTVKSLLALTVL